MKVVVNGLFLSQDITGVQRYATVISRELKKLLGNKIKFVAPRNIIHKRLAEETEVEVIGNFTGLLWEQIDLPAYLLKNNGPVLLNLRNTAPFFYKKNIIVLHDLIFMKNPNRFSKKCLFFYRILAPLLYGNALKLITVSRFSKRDIANTFKLNEREVEVVYNSVSEDIEKYTNQDFDNEYGDYVLSVASLLSPRKNLGNTIKAFNKLNNDKLKLVIVGAELKNFSDKEVFERLKHNKNIILVGNVSDKKLAGLYKNAKMLAFPSFYEGFGLPPLEALHFGCPVLVSDVTSLPEVCGDAAYYVNPHNIDEIAEGMDKLLHNKELRNDLIQRGNKRHAFFNREDSVRKLIEIIESIEVSA